MYQDARGRWCSTINGKRHRFGKDYVRACHLFKLAKIEAGKEGPVDNKPPSSVGGVITRWAEQYGTEFSGYALVHLGDAFGLMLLVDVPPDILGRFARSLEKKNLSPKTVRSYCNVADQCLRWAKDQGWIAVDLKRPKLKTPSKRPRDFDPKKLSKILPKLNPHVRPLAMFIATTGCRPGEACPLRWDQIDMRAKIATLREHKTAWKTGEDRTIYLPPAALDVLRGIKRKGRTKYVFPSSRSPHYTVAGLRAILRRHDEKLTPYSLRHTFAQVLSESLSLQDLAKLMGHKSTAITRHYFDVRDRRAIHVAENIKLPYTQSAPQQSRARKASGS